MSAVEPHAISTVYRATALVRMCAGLARTDLLEEREENIVSYRQRFMAGNQIADDVKMGVCAL